MATKLQITSGKDAFGETINFGDQVATLPLENVPKRGIVIQFGKAGVKIQMFDKDNVPTGQRWVYYERAIKTKDRKDIE